LSGLVEDVAARETNGAHEDRQIVCRLAEEHLSPRQQRIIELCMDGWSIGDIAGQLQTPTAQISDDKYKAIQKLRRHADTV
jgi:DNA-binding NarL/FixJ family response regulator